VVGEEPCGFQKDIVGRAGSLGNWAKGLAEGENSIAIRVKMVFAMGAVLVGKAGWKDGQPELAQEGNGESAIIMHAGILNPAGERCQGDAQQRGKERWQGCLKHGRGVDDAVEE
jgi:hypothetical protein